MEERKYYQLKKDWPHPYMVYGKGCVHSSVMWADKLGHGMTQFEFERLVSTDDRFSEYFEPK